MSDLILECDQGNTRCKWRVCDSSGVVSRGHCGPGQDIRGMTDLGAVARVRIASVASQALLGQLLDQLRGLNATIELAKPARQLAGVSNAYGDEFEKLGVDRWLAVVAAYKKVAGAVLVLDAGSALTADLVDASGAHLGGYIAPGAALMKNSLLVDTGRVRFEEGYMPARLDFGTSTQVAVDAGVFAAQLGMVQVAIERARRRIPSDFAILVTGGAGKQIISHLGEPSEYVPELVLDGLAWALP